jgi:hypothetical protein
MILSGPGPAFCMPLLSVVSGPPLNRYLHVLLVVHDGAAAGCCQVMHELGTIRGTPRS